jgi:plasmid stabilization system protein ParE
MNLPVVFRPIAKEEMNESIEWYETQRTGLGSEFASEVETFLARMARSPEQFGRIRGPIRRAVLRRFPFIIHFLDEPNRIVVLAVFHGKRNPKRLEGR